MWHLPCAETEVQAYQEKFRVTNIACDEHMGDVILRVLSDDKPMETAVTVAPTLEDYYLYVFGETSSGNT